MNSSLAITLTIYPYWWVLIWTCCGIPILAWALRWSAKDVGGWRNLEPLRAIAASAFMLIAWPFILYVLVDESRKRRRRKRSGLMWANADDI